VKLSKFKKLENYWLSRAKNVRDLKYAQEQEGFVMTANYPKELQEYVNQYEFGHCERYRYLIKPIHEDEEWISEEEEKKQQRRLNHWTRRVEK